MADRALVGRTALVTGASAGIGKSFCEQLAAKGMNIVMVARNAEKLKSVAEEIRARHGVEVRAISADLGQDGLQGSKCQVLPAREVGQ